jgi:uracil phosphoribosyltransferase
MGSMQIDNLHLVDHPLVQHKLTLMRQRDRSANGFRDLLNEIGMLLCYEATRSLSTELIDIETPVASMKSPRILRC